MEDMPAVMKMTMMNSIERCAKDPTYKMDHKDYGFTVFRRIIEDETVIMLSLYNPEYINKEKENG